mgnify:CR=1 FL=1
MSFDYETKLSRNARITRVLLKSDSSNRVKVGGQFIEVYSQSAGWIEQFYVHNSIKLGDRILAKVSGNYMYLVSVILW